MGLVRLGMALVVAASCYAPTVTPGAPCGAGDACPSGLVCQADRCVLPGAPSDAPAPVPDVAVDAAVDAPPDAPGCPASWIPLGGSDHVYRVSTTRRRWIEARDDCASSGGYLAVPDSFGELQALLTATGTNTWIGIDDIASEGTFVASHTNLPATYLPWDTGEPDDDDALDPTGQDCVEILEITERLDDEYCTRLRGYACECEP